MWESRPLPKIARKPPLAALSARGASRIRSMLPRLACKTPQLREFPNHPTASYIPPSLPPSLHHLALNRADLETLAGC